MIERSYRFEIFDFELSNEISDEFVMKFLNIKTFLSLSKIRDERLRYDLSFMFPLIMICDKKTNERFGKQA